MATSGPTANENWAVPPAGQTRPAEPLSNIQRGMNQMSVSNEASSAIPKHLASKMAKNVISAAGDEEFEGPFDIPY